MRREHAPEREGQDRIHRHGRDLEINRVEKEHEQCQQGDGEADQVVYVPVVHDTRSHRDDEFRAGLRLHRYNRLLDPLFARFGCEEVAHGSLEACRSVCSLKMTDNLMRVPHGLAIGADFFWDEERTAEKIYFKKYLTAATYPVLISEIENKFSVSIAEKIAYKNAKTYLEKYFRTSE